MHAQRRRAAEPMRRVHIPGNGKNKSAFVRVPYVTPVKKKIRANGREYLTITNSSVLERGAFRTAVAIRGMQDRLAKAFAAGKMTKDQYLRLRKKIEAKGERLHGLIHRQSIRLAERDPMLTVLYNRAKFFRRLNETIRARSGKPMTYMILDVDFFKKINDKLGHGAGDIALKFFSNAVSKVSKKFDGFAGRYGGEEIVVAFPRGQHMALSFVSQLNRELVQSFAREETVRSALQGNLFTFSAGAHQVKAGETMNDLAKIADQKLYQSKDSGRDMVVFDVDATHSKVRLAHSIRVGKRGP